MKLVVGVGAGGHARVIMDILTTNGDFQILGLVEERPEIWNERVMGVTVVGGDEELPRLYHQGVRHAFMAVASLENTAKNKEIFDRVHALGFEMINVIHSKAIVSPSVRMGWGNRIFAGAIINPDTVLGSDVVVNTGAIVEHDCKIEDHAQIAPGAKIAGGVWVEEGSLVGLGASVIQGVRIGRYSKIGAGAVVTRNVPDSVTVVGVPAKVVENIKTGVIK